MRITRSIEGRDVGLGANTSTGLPGPLISRGGLMVGEHGSQIMMHGPKQIAIFDDFLAVAAAAPSAVLWSLLEGTDSATSAELVAAAKDGVLRITTGDAGTGFAADAAQIVNGLHWYAADGGLAMEARVKLSAITTCTAFVGFTDSVSLEQSILFATGSTFTTNATDACGFLFDTVSTNDTWYLTGVANDVDATMQDTTFAPVAATYETFRVELSATGVATFFRNGVQVGTAMTGAVTPTVALTPTIYVSKLSVAASMTMDIDYIHTAKYRG